jgi:hypothetical protein
MNEIEGGCLCGNIKYYSKSGPLFTTICHCSHCQKQSGTAFSIIIGIEKKALHIKGNMKSYKDMGNSGKPVHRKFCGNCGSPIISDVSAAPDLFFIKAGTINNIKSLNPTKEIWTDHKLDCISINGIKEKHKTDGK